MKRAQTPVRDGSGDRRKIEIVARDRHIFGVADRHALPRAEQTCSVECASGERTTACWTGVPVAELLSRVDAPPETTHLRLDSDDGYRVCVSIHDALDGLVAYARDGEPLAERSPYRTRFVASGVDGERLIKGIRRIETVALAADDDPEGLENVTLDDSRYG